MLPGRGLCDELITRSEESYRLCCVVVCDLETSRMGAPYIYDISRLRVKIEVYARSKRFISLAAIHRKYAQVLGFPATRYSTERGAPFEPVWEHCWRVKVVCQSDIGRNGHRNEQCRIAAARRNFTRTLGFG